MIISFGWVIDSLLVMILVPVLVTTLCAAMVNVGKTLAVFSYLPSDHYDDDDDDDDDDYGDADFVAEDPKK